MPHRLYRVTAFEIVDQYVLRITFDDGSQRVIDFEPVLHGEVFEPLRNPLLFRQVRLDQSARTLVWPNGADFDPETLRHWDDRDMAALGQRWAEIAEPAQDRV